jgi:hypothetical protein
MEEKTETLKIGVVIKIDEALDFQLQQHILELKKTGVRTTKAELAVKLLKIGLMEENKTLIHE